MYNIQILNNMAKEGTKVFNKEKYSLGDDFKNPDGIIVRSKPIHDMEFGSNLKIVARIGAGVNNIPVEKCTEKGICVVNCPGGNANAVKELTIASIVMLMRNAVPAMEWVKNLPEEDTKYGSNVVENGKEAFRGPEIMGKQIAIIGVGNIGSRMAKACHDLGMRVVGYDPYLSQARQQELSGYLEFTSTLEEAITGSDIITMHTPLNEETRNTINKDTIALMNNDVYIINYARGGIVDDDAICEALESGKVAGYATDFPTQNQMKLKNVLFTPHLASGTPEAEINCSVMGARQTIDYLENGNITNSVNLPDVSFARSDGDRITVIHVNKVGMLGLMTEKVSALGLNIENLINKAKDDIAYTILDFNTETPAQLENILSEIDGVIRVRVIK